MELNNSSYSQRTSGSSISTETGTSAPYKTQVNNATSSTNDGLSHEVSLSQLKPGQKIEGTVVDLRNNEVSIELNNGQILKARLEGSVELSIGQKAIFQVDDKQSDRITLKYIPTSSLPSQNLTIIKALQESGLAKSERSIAIVESLLKYSMSIDKQTLQTLVKASYIDKNVSPESLVQMFKNNMPLTRENITKFEAYQNGTGSLLQDMQLAAKNIVDHLQSFTVSTPKEAIQLHTELLQVLNNDLTDKASENNSTEPLLMQSLSREELDILSKAVSNHLNGLPSSLPDDKEAGLPSDFYQSIRSGSIPLSDAVSILSKLFPEQAKEMSLEDKDMDSITTQSPTSKEEFIQNTSFKNKLTEIIESLKEDLFSLKQSSGEIGVFLNAEERSSLYQNLAALPDSEIHKESILNGTAKITDVLTFLQQKLPDMEEADMKKLLTATEYPKLMERAFLHKWELTPNKLKEDGSLEKLYNVIQKDFEQLKQLMQSHENIDKNYLLNNQVKNTQDSLSFMKTMNQAFHFIELPLQLKNQDVHGELYVYAKKKNYKKQDSLSVLLHLDMENLGPTNIHITLDHNQVNAVFYLEDSQAADIIQDHLPQLENALQKKGYHIYSEVKKSYQKPDFSQVIAEEDTMYSSVKRYTFDIRT